MKQSYLRCKLLAAVLICLFVNTSVVEAQELSASNSTTQRIDLEGNYSYQRYIESDAVLSGKPFRKIRHGYGFALNYTNSLSKRVSFETGLMLLSDTHILDSVALYCGPSNCTYGYLKNTYLSLGIPLFFGVNSNNMGKWGLSCGGGMVMTKGGYDYVKYFYYDGIKYSQEGTWYFDTLVINLSAKAAVTYQVHNTQVSLVYRYTHPLNVLDRAHLAFSRHSIGIGVGIWSK